MSRLGERMSLVSMTKWRTLALATAAANGYIHSGYPIVAVCVVPILLLNAWVYRPKLATRAHTSRAAPSLLSPVHAIDPSNTPEDDTLQGND